MRRNVQAGPRFADVCGHAVDQGSCVPSVVLGCTCGLSLPVALRRRWAAERSGASTRQPPRRTPAPRAIDAEMMGPFRSLRMAAEECNPPELRYENDPELTSNHKLAVEAPQFHGKSRDERRKSRRQVKDGPSYAKRNVKLAPKAGKHMLAADVTATSLS
jgi:hypothetical protein